MYYSARRLIGSRIVESAAYCNHKLLALLHLNSTQTTSVNWIIRLLLSLLCWPKVILLSGGHCINFVWNKRVFLMTVIVITELNCKWLFLLIKVQHFHSLFYTLANSWFLNNTSELPRKIFFFMILNKSTKELRIIYWFYF